MEETKWCLLVIGSRQPKYSSNGWSKDLVKHPYRPQFW